MHQVNIEQSTFITVDKDGVQATIERLRQSLAEHPEDGKARYCLGLCYYNLGLIDESVEQIQQAVALMPEKTEIRYEMAVLFHQQEKTKDALKHLDKVIEQDQTFSPALVLRGLIYQGRGSIKKAVTDWQTAFQLGDEASVEYLQAFIQEYKHLIPTYLEPAAFSDRLKTYVQLSRTPQPRQPNPLGTTRLRILTTIWPAKVEVLQGMYESDMSEYRKTLTDLKEQRRVMEEDLLGLSTLCVAVYDEEKARVKAQAQAEAQAQVKAQAQTKLAARELTLEERQSILDRMIGQYSRQNFRVTSRSATSVQLVQPKKFSLFWALFWFLFYGIGILIYIFYYLAKRDKVIYLEIGPRGQVIKR